SALEGIGFRLAAHGGGALFTAHDDDLVADFHFDLDGLDGIVAHGALRLHDRSPRRQNAEVDAAAGVPVRDYARETDVHAPRILLISAIGRRDASRRNVLGARANSLRKASLKCPRLEKPRSRANAVVSRSPSASRSTAARKRSRVR